MDVFVAEPFRGKGHAASLISYILALPELKDVKIWRLATSDAQGLYRKFGFRPLAEPEKLMELIK